MESIEALTGMFHSHSHCRNQHERKMNERAAQVRAKLPAGYVMSPEEERAIHHMELGTICKCGHKETRVRHLKHT